MDGDVPFVSRQGEEEVFAIMREPEEGAEDEDSEIGGPTPSGEVY